MILVSVATFSFLYPSLNIQFLSPSVAQYLFFIHRFGLFGCLRSAHFHNIVNMVWSSFANVSLACTVRWLLLQPVMIGLRDLINSVWLLAMRPFTMVLSFSVSLLNDSWEGFVMSFPLYFLNVHPRKSNPSSMCVMSVFSSEELGTG